uniref:CYP74A1 n=1 Tax=Arundo donax TaxID=35708 RepID=A0A0A9EFH2_ARUDO
MKVPVKRSVLSTSEVSKSTGKEAASRSATTRGSRATNGPGGMLSRTTVDRCARTRDVKKPSRPPGP